MNTVLSIGSNLGDRLYNLQQARDRIYCIPGVKPVLQSPVYETDPVNVSPEYSDHLFLNAILLIDCDIEPHKLLEQLKNIETDIGRAGSVERNAPRLIDIDIISMEDTNIDTPTLTIPHPRWKKRLFVVRPLADLLPDLVLPGGTETVGEILLSLPKLPKVLPLYEKW